MQFHFSGLLLRFTGYERSVTVEADSLAEAMRSVRVRFPQLGPVLWDDEGRLRQVHRLIVNGEVVAADTDRPLRDGDEVEFLTAVAGG
ncbi:MoaD/ThiS family protein [Streptomyces indicus]|uniref:Molybdopterin converting factor, small subunit n=1 Tax=Streptomyces indicus TaxID=417292 RepID=A0A1G8VXH7_9ACTN|nr:MoaD/ThiS family protein [Streptomyces indicus]SDJ70195.1 Molybdopterin converting factor, small subunit [Streptomyces indicus]